MPRPKNHSFSACIEIIGINPFVSLPEQVLHSLFAEAGKEKSPIPVKGTIHTKPFIQTLVKYAGKWRLYINTRMLKNSPQRVGETITISIAFDPAERSLQLHPKLVQAFTKNKKAKKIYDGLAPFLQKEIASYISRLKSEEAVVKNIEKAIGFLEGRNKFIGREQL